MTVPLFFALYCLEAGLFFIVVPWTRVWVMNPILQASPDLMLFATNPLVRGFVSGFGVVHLLIGRRDILHFGQEGRGRPGGWVAGRRRGGRRCRPWWRG